MNPTQDLKACIVPLQAHVSVGWDRVGARDETVTVTTSSPNIKTGTHPQIPISKEDRKLR